MVRIDLMALWLNEERAQRRGNRRGNGKGYDPQGKGGKGKGYEPQGEGGGKEKAMSHKGKGEKENAMSHKGKGKRTACEGKPRAPQTMQCSQSLAVDGCGNLINSHVPWPTSHFVFCTLP